MLDSFFQRPNWTRRNRTKVANGVAGMDGLFSEFNICGRRSVSYWKLWVLVATCSVSAAFIYFHTATTLNTTCLSLIGFIYFNFCVLKYVSLIFFNWFRNVGTIFSISTINVAAARTLLLLMDVVTIIIKIVIFTFHLTN